MNEKQIANLKRLIQSVDIFCLSIIEWCDLLNQNLLKELGIEPYLQREILNTGLFGVVMGPKRTEIFSANHCSSEHFQVPIVEFEHLIDKNSMMKKWSKNYSLNNDAEVDEAIALAEGIVKGFKEK